MTKQELLTKLAMECATWEEAMELGTKIEFACLMGGNAFNVGSLREHEWLAERKRLINAPSWAGAPKDATHKAMDSDGRHHFFIGEPHLGVVRLEWFPEPVSDGGWVYRAGKAIAIPAGYDWRDSLEERPA